MFKIKSHIIVVERPPYHNDLGVSLRLSDLHTRLSLTYLLFMVSTFISCYVINIYRIHIYRFQFCCSEIGLWGVSRSLMRLAWTNLKSTIEFWMFNFPFG